MNTTLKIFSIISQITGYSQEEFNIKDELYLLGIDSLRKVELILQIEEFFHIQFNDSDLDPTQLSTVADIIWLVTKNVTKQTT